MCSMSSRIWTIRTTGMNCWECRILSPGRKSISLLGMLMSGMIDKEFNANCRKVVLSISCHVAIKLPVYILGTNYIAPFIYIAQISSSP